MKLNFITKSDTTKLILIFPGWSCSPGLYSDLEFIGWDIAVVDDFSEYTFDYEVLKGYPTIYVMAWSLGVYWAEKSGIAPMVTSAFAINGSGCPANDDFGIPRIIFHDTAANLSTNNLKKFRRRMAGNRETFNKIFNSSEESAEIIESLRSQLYRIETETKSELPSSGSLTLPWLRAYISEADAIFPPESQRNFWNKAGVSLVELNAPHYVDMADVIRSSIPEVNCIGQRFTKAEATYDNEAVVQRHMAEDLKKLFLRKHPADKGHFLEIGAGTGLFTAQYVPQCNPASIDFVDISAVVPDLKRAGAQNIPHRFHIADAEEWLAATSLMFDAIVSSATVQWFSNLPNFINECANHLNPGGSLAFSTFLPGNLMELDSIRPTPLNYLSGEYIKNVLESRFVHVEYHEDCVTLEFNSGLDVLRHLQLTGVAGSEGSGKNLWKMRRLRSLTFRYGCFAAKKSDPDC